MSNLSIFANNAAVPAFARNNALSEVAKALLGGAVSNMKRISIKGGVFRLLAGGKEVAAIEERFLDVIVVKAAPKVSRVFYAKTYDSETIGAPDCSSADGEKPDTNVENSQSAVCMSCPQNIAGSGKENSRACRFQQRMAVVLAADPEGDVLQLSLPATSIFGKEEGDKRPLQAFVRHLAVQNPPINPEQIVTRMRFDTKSESPKVFFQPMRWLTEDEYEIVLEQGQTDSAKSACSMGSASVDSKVEVALLEGKPIAKVKVAPVVEVAEPVEENVEASEPPAPAPKAPRKTRPKATEVLAASDILEPEVRKAPAKTNAVPVVSSALADIVAGWDDDEE